MSDEALKNERETQLPPKIGMNVPKWHDSIGVAISIKLAWLAKTVSQARVVSLTARKVTVTTPREVSMMVMNRIQFQPGLSMPEFFEAYGAEAQCEQALEAVR